LAEGSRRIVARLEPRSGWLKVDFVIDRISQWLLAAEIALRGLNADMPEQELDLFKLPAGLMTHAGTRTTQIVRRNVVKRISRIQPLRRPK
jgi:hypothetical protein